LRNVVSSSPVADVQPPVVLRADEWTDRG